MEQQQNFLQEFSDVGKGVSKYITLDVLQLGDPYEIARFRLHESAYGRCLVVDLAIGFWFVLPKRIGDLVSTGERLECLNSQHFWLIFKGRHEKYRKMALVEFKTVEQFMMEQVPTAPDMPMINFAFNDLLSGTTVNEVGVQTEVVQPVQPPLEQETKQDKDKDIRKTGAPPKVTIKVKKERR